MSSVEGGRPAARRVPGTGQSFRLPDVPVTVTQRSPPPIVVQAPAVVNLGIFEIRTVNPDRLNNFSVAVLRPWCSRVDGDGRVVKPRVRTHRRLSGDNLGEVHGRAIDATERSTKLETEPRQDIVGEDELVSYQARKRKEFEDRTRMNRHDMSAWVAYAKFEASMKEFTRTRSVWERALQVDMNQASIWLKYVEFEQKEGFINHARNLFDRVTLHLPRVDQFWYKYAYMEELLGNFSGARAIFERWMEFEPEDNVGGEGYVQHGAPGGGRRGRDTTFFEFLFEVEEDCVGVLAGY